MEKFADHIFELAKKRKRCHETFDKQHFKKSKTNHNKYNENITTNNQADSTLNTSNRNEEHILLQEKKKKKKKNVDNDISFVDTAVPKKLKKSVHKPSDNLDTNPIITCSENNDVINSYILSTLEDNGSTSVLQDTKKKKKKKKKESYDKDILFVDTVTPKKHKKERNISYHKPNDDCDTSQIVTCNENNDVIESYNLNTPEDNEASSLLQETKKKKKKKKSRSVDEDILYVDTAVPKKHKIGQKILNHKPNGNFEINPIVTCKNISDVITSCKLNTPEDDESPSLLQKTKKKKKKKSVYEDILNIGMETPKKHNKEKKNLCHKPNDNFETNPIMTCRKNSDVVASLLSYPEDGKSTSLLQETQKKKKKKKKKSVDEDILYVDTVASKKHKKGQKKSHEPKDNLETNPTITCSENNDVINNNILSIPEDDDLTSLFQGTKKKNKKKKSVDKVINQEKKIIPDKADAIIKKTMSDDNFEKIVHNKTVVPNEAKYNSKIGTSDLSNTSSKHFSALKKQKMTDEKQKDGQANGSKNILKLEEERILLPLETKRKKKKHKNVEDILNDDTVAPYEQLISCHKLNDHFDSNQNVCSENNGVVTHNSNFTEDDEHSLLLSMTMKLKKKKKKNDHKVEKKKKKKIVEKPKENQQQIINDAIHERKVKTKTISSNKEKCNPKIVKFINCDTSTEYLLALEEQKLRTSIKKKDDLITLMSSEESKETSILNESKKREEGSNKVENQESQQTIINDAIHERKVKTKTIDSNKEKCYPKIVKFINIDTSAEYLLALEEQKKRTLVKKKDDLITLMSSEESKETSKLNESKKREEGSNKVENQEKAKENQQSIINDATHERKVKTKTIGSNKEKCNPKIVRFINSDTSTEYLLALEEQKKKGV